MDVRHPSPHNRVVGAEHSDSRREEYESGHDWQQAADRAQDQKANPDHSADDMPQSSW